MDNVFGSTSPSAGKTSQSDDFYSDDLNAQVIAENNLDPDALKEDEDLPITTGDISIGDLDEEPIDDDGISDDEENMAGGEDNVITNDFDDAVVGNDVDVDIEDLEE